MTVRLKAYPVTGVFGNAEGSCGAKYAAIAVILGVDCYSCASVP